MTKKLEPKMRKKKIKAPVDHGILPVPTHDEIKVQFINEHEVILVEENNINWKSLPDKIDLVDHEELSKPEVKTSWDWAIYCVIIALCGLVCALAYAATFLY